MKNLIFILLSFISINLSAQDVTAIFANVPDDVVYNLSPEDKIVLTSNPTDTAVQIENSLEGITKRLAISADYIALQTSEAGTVQIKLLPLINDSKIICVINTVCGKACDSQIRFYNTNWVALDKTALFAKKALSWFLKPDNDTTNENYKNALTIVNKLPVKLTLNATDLTVKAEYDAQNHLTKEDYDALKPYLTEQPKTFTWNRTAFQ